MTSIYDFFLQMVTTYLRAAIHLMFVSQINWTLLVKKISNIYLIASNFNPLNFIQLKSKTQTWDPSLYVNGRHRDDDIFAFFDVLKIKVAGVVAKTVQVEEFVTVAVSGVHVAKLKK